MNKTVANNKKFGLVTGGIIIGIFAYQFFVRQTQWFFLLGLGSALILVALAKPTWLNGLRRAWIRVGDLLGVVNTYLILSILYLLIITPIGWILRLLRKIAIFPRWEPRKQSYWVKVDDQVMESFEKQF